MLPSAADAVERMCFNRANTNTVVAAKIQTEAKMMEDLDNESGWPALERKGQSANKRIKSRRKNFLFVWRYHPGK